MKTVKTLIVMTLMILGSLHNAKAQAAQLLSSVEGSVAMVQVAEQQHLLALVEASATASANASQLPQFPGGKKALEAFLANELTYPEAAREAAIEGEVSVQVTIQPDGSLTNVKVIRSCHEMLNEAAVRAVEALPAWEPARQMGRAVACKLSIPVHFALQ